MYSIMRWACMSFSVFSAWLLVWQPTDLATLYRKMMLLQMVLRIVVIGFPDRFDSMNWESTSFRLGSCQGYMDGSVWLSYTHGDSRPTTNVKCWMYAPEIPEHHTKKG